MRIDVYHHLPDEADPRWLAALKAHITSTGEQIMTTVTDAIDAVKAAADTHAAVLGDAISNLAQDIGQLQAEIASLQAGSTLSAEDQAKLDSIVENLGAIADQAKTLSEVVKAPGEA